MQEITNWFLYQQLQQQVITVPTRTILHPQLDFIAIIDIHEINKSVFNRKQEKKAISRHPIFLTDSDDDYILEEIYCRETNSLKEM